MLRRFSQRLLVAMIRFAAAGMGVLVLVEFAFGVLGGSKFHVWEPDSWGGIPVDLSSRSQTWSDLLLERTVASARVLVLALPSVWLVGYAWGLLGARLRRYHGSKWLVAPFAVFAGVPGFWFVGLVAIYSYFHWQRPGFADDLVVEQGPDLLAWWNAAVVALPLAASGVVWHLLSVSAVLEREAARPWVRGLHAAGADDEEIFYRRVTRLAAPSLVSLSDRFLPTMMGGLVVLEAAFHFPGVGALLVSSLRAGFYPGIVFSTLALTFVVVVATAFREWLSTRPPLA